MLKRSWSGLGAGASRWLLATAAVVILQAVSPSAQADNDCGVPAANVVICNPGTQTDPFNNADGITYNDDAGANSAVNLTLTHDAGTTAEFIRLGNPVGPPDAFGNLTIFNNGTINQTLTSDGNAPAGLFALTSNGTAAITNTATINTSSDFVEGIFAAGTGNATVVNSGAIATTGTSAEGIDVTSTNGLASITNSAQIRTQGGSSYGISSGSNNGNAEVIALTGSDVGTTGNDAHGLYALSLGGSVTIEAEGLVSTSGTGSHGVFAWVFPPGGAGTATVSGGVDSTVTGANSHALNAETNSGLIDIDVTGTYSAGAAAGNGIRAVSTTGSLDISATGGVNSAGAGMAAFLASGIADTDVTLGGVVQGNGAGASAAVITGNESTLALTGTAAVFGQATAISLTSTLAATLTFADGSTIAAGDDIALLVTSAGGSGTTSAADITGRITMTAGADTFANNGSFDLQDRFNATAVNAFGGGADSFTNGAAGAVRLMSINAGGDTGVFQALETFSNAGLITLADLQTGGGAPAANDLLRIEGSYQSNGGSLSLDTVLGDDTSDSDILEITGTVTTVGTSTLVQIANAGGTGAQTVGNGILVIDVTGASAADAFVLAGEVVAGDYSYDLVLQADGNWYLVSALLELLVTNPELEAYRVVPSMLLEGWYATLGSLDERLGELRHGLDRPLGQSAALGAGDAQEAVRPGAGGRPLDGIWMRGVGQDLTVNDSVGLGFDQQVAALQVGYDRGWRDAMSEGDMLLFGAFGGIDSGSGDVTSGGIDTAFDLEGFQAGLYGSWVAANGFYFDAVAKVDWLTIDQSAATAGLTAEYNALVAGVSLEAGYHFAMGGGFYIEPEAQLTYARTWIEDADDSIGATATFDDADSLRGRLGIRAGKTFDVGRGLITPYLEASVVQEFLGDSSVTVTEGDRSVDLDNDLNGTRYEVGFGLDASLASSGLSLYVDADYIGGEDTQGVKLLGGIRVAW